MCVHAVLSAKACSAVWCSAVRVQVQSVRERVAVAAATVEKQACTVLVDLFIVDLSR